MGRVTDIYIKEIYSNKLYNSIYFHLKEILQNERKVNNIDEYIIKEVTKKPLILKEWIKKTNNTKLQDDFKKYELNENNKIVEIADINNRLEAIRTLIYKKGYKLKYLKIIYDDVERQLSSLLKMEQWVETPVEICKIISRSIYSLKINGKETNIKYQDCFKKQRRF